MDNLTPEQRKKNMQAIKATGTRIEVSLAKSLFAKGYRYRKNDKTVFGKPDLTFKKHKLAIFIDGEFWHGKDWEIRKYNLKSNCEYWLSKIERNINRDKEVNEKLLSENKKILRFWGNEIKKDLNNCITKIQKTIDET